MASIQPSAVPHVVIVDDDNDHSLIVRLVLLELSPLADITVLGDLHNLGARLEQVPPDALVLLDRLYRGRPRAKTIALAVYVVVQKPGVSQP